MSEGPKKKDFKDPIQKFYYYDLMKFLTSDKKRYSTILSNVINDFETGNLGKKYKEGIKIKKLLSLNKQNMIVMNSEPLLISVGGYGQIYKLSDDVCIKINLSERDEYHEYEIPMYLSGIADENIKQLVLFPLSIMKHCTFSGLINSVQLNVFFVYIAYCYLFKKKITGPEIEKKLALYNIGTEFTALFNGANKQDTVDFMNFLFNHYLSSSEIINLVTFLPKVTERFMAKKKLNYNGFIIILPLLKENAIRLRLNEKCGIDKNGKRAYQVIKQYHRIVFLQMSILILSIDDRTSFSHNDFKPDNILVDEKERNYQLHFKNAHFRFDIPFIFKLADFDFSSLTAYGVNEKLRNKELFEKSNWLTDIHFLVHNLFLFISEDEYKSDKHFFNTLHETFISPYCNQPIEKMLVETNSVIKRQGKTYCDAGRLVDPKKISIESLFKFITSDLFSNWIVKP